MKKILQKIGRFFVVLSQKYEKDIRQPVLLVDGSFILPNDFGLIIRGVKDKFKNANLVVLTFQDKKEFIRDNFPDVEIIVAEKGSKIRRRHLGIQLLFLLRRRKFDFIVLSSLDISLVAAALIFSKCRVFLHNRWLEWYRIRYRTVLDILLGVKSADRNRRLRNKNIKDLLKSTGRIFVMLTDFNPEYAKSHILIVDNGHTDIGHVSTAVRRAAENFINPDITVLTFAARRHYFTDMFPWAKVVVIEEPGIRFCLALKMYRMRKPKFNIVVLTNLDVSPIIISFLFIRTKVLLYNQWHQWWSLDFRNISGYLKEFVKFLIMMPLFVYLLITAVFILLKTGVRLGLNSLAKERR